MDDSMTRLPVNTTVEALLDGLGFGDSNQTRQLLSLVGAVVGMNLLLVFTYVTSPYGWLLVLVDLLAGALILKLWIGMDKRPKGYTPSDIQVRICTGLSGLSLAGHLLLGEAAQLTVLVLAVALLAQRTKARKQAQNWGLAVVEERRRQVEEHQRKGRTAERQRLAVEASCHGYWYWDLQADRIQFSSSWAVMLGHTAEELSSDPETWFSRVHPFYLPEIKEALSAHLYGRNERFQSQYRIQHRDGTYLWVMNRGVALRDSDDAPIAIAGSQIDITQLVDVEKSIVDEAFRDRLTDLPNRQALLVRLERAVEHLKRGETRQLAVMFLDLDRFKVINDSLGHLVGDQLLSAVAARLRNCVRQSRGDLIARFGGDEFVVLLEELPLAEEALEIGKRMIDAVASPIRIGQHEIRTGLSIGIALGDRNVEHAEDLLRNADAAMYHAKEGGRGRIEFFSANMHAQAVRLNQLQNDLSEAVTRDGLVLHYQPIMSARSGAIEAAEALVRWRHPSGELVGPSEFIPIAEETGLITAIGEWVLRRACCENVRWQKAGRPALKMSVNVSPHQLADPSLPSVVRDILEESGLPAHLLELEITETALMSNIEIVRETIDRLAGFGVSVSLDDFGTGYSSLEHLRRFQFRTIKMDRSFVAGLTTDSRAAAVANGLINLVHQLGSTVTAEGVETFQQLEFLRSHECDRVQGYFASRPVDARAFSELLESNFSLVGYPLDSGDPKM